MADMHGMEEDARKDLEAKAAALGVAVAAGLNDEDLRALLAERRRQNALATLHELGVRAKASQTLEELEMVVLVQKLGDAGDPLNLPPCHSLRLLPMGYPYNPVLDLQDPDCLRCIDLVTCKPADPRYAERWQEEAPEEEVLEEFEGEAAAEGVEEVVAQTEVPGEITPVTEETVEEAAAVVAVSEPGESPEESDMAKKTSKPKKTKDPAAHAAAKKSAREAKAAIRALKPKKAAKEKGPKEDARKSRQTRTTNGVPVALSDPMIKPLIGKQITKTWRRRGDEPLEIKVDVREDGFYYEGERYGSLSKIVLVITGQQRNGPAWFGLRGD